MEDRSEGQKEAGTNTSLSTESVMINDPHHPHFSQQLDPKEHRPSLDRHERQAAIEPKGLLQGKEVHSS